MLLTTSVEGCQCSKNEFLNEFLTLTFRFLQTQGSEFLTEFPTEFPLRIGNLIFDVRLAFSKSI